MAEYSMTGRSSNPRQMNTNKSSYNAETLKINRFNFLSENSATNHETFGNCRVQERLKENKGCFKLTPVTNRAVGYSSSFRNSHQFREITRIIKNSRDSNTSSSGHCYSQQGFQDTSKLINNRTSHKNNSCQKNLEYSENSRSIQNTVDDTVCNGKNEHWQEKPQCGDKTRIIRVTTDNTSSINRNYPQQKLQNTTKLTNNSFYNSLQYVENSRSIQSTVYNTMSNSTSKSSHKSPLYRNSTRMFCDADNTTSGSGSYLQDRLQNISALINNRSKNSPYKGDNQKSLCIPELVTAEKCPNTYQKVTEEETFHKHSSQKFCAPTIENSSPRTSNSNLQHRLLQAKTCKDFSSQQKLHNQMSTSVTNEDCMTVPKQNGRSAIAPSMDTNQENKPLKISEILQIHMEEIASKQTSNQEGNSTSHIDNYDIKSINIEMIAQNFEDLKISFETNKYCSDDELIQKL